MSTQTTRRWTAFTRGLDHVTWGDAVVLLGCLIWVAALFLATERRSPPLPDFTDLEASERKTAFFEYLGPMVASANERALADRRLVQELTAKQASGAQLSWLERRRVESLARKYEVDYEDKTVDDVLSDLTPRTGVIPESLVLIQAAKESGWGTSRFATEGNNLFGQRCYEPSCGIAPQSRKNPRFGLAQFKSVLDSIDSYALNLNTHTRYQRFREMRHSARTQNKPLSGLDLAQGLLRYSERGQAYVDEIRAMIRQNNLE